MAPIDPVYSHSNPRVRKLNEAQKREAVELYENAYPEHVLKDSAERWLDGTFPADRS